MSPVILNLGLCDEERKRGLVVVVVVVGGRMSTEQMPAHKGPSDEEANDENKCSAEERYQRGQHQSPEQQCGIRVEV